MALLELRDVHTYYGNIHALKGISLHIDVGEIVTMQGQGVGRVAEVNLALETLKIDFEKRTGVVTDRVP